MTDFSFYLRAFGQRLVATLGLILLWRFLWPTLYKTLSSLAQQDGTILGIFTVRDLNSSFWQVFFYSSSHSGSIAIQEDFFKNGIWQG
jgi:hypothetical protein